MKKEVKKKKKETKAKKQSSDANIGFEAKLWLAADKLRNNKEPTCWKRA